MSESRFKVGDIVILQNLKIHPECNDRETTVIGPGELRESHRGVEPVPIEYLYRVDINLAGCEPGLLVAEYQMRHRKPPVELGNWSPIEKATNWNPINVTENIHPPGTPLPAPDLSDMDHFHLMIATGRLADIFTRLAGTPDRQPIHRPAGPGLQPSRRGPGERDLQVLLHRDDVDMNQLGETVADERAHLAVQRAADLIANAEALLIMAGAGMSVDSGLPDFRSPQGFWRAYPPLEKLGLSFEDMAQPRWFAEKPRMAWAWYGHRQQLYRETKPHAGYQLLREWGQAMPAGSFVVTSNVDGHFFFAEFPADRIVEKHGSIHRYQCTTPCTTATWRDTPPDLMIGLKTLQAFGELPHCPECGAVARPNVLMFNDDAWIADRTFEQQERYTDWLAGLRGKRVVIIECGAGTAIPTIRLAAQRTAETSFATLIRVNPTPAEGDESAVVLRLPALQALTRIQQALPESFRLRCADSAPKENKPSTIVAFSAISTDHLKYIKHSKVYSKAWQITLPCGWIVWVDHLDVRRTYGGMIEGLPWRQLTDDEIESARVFVRTNFHGPEPVVIPPKLYDAKSKSPILPALRFAAQIRTFEPLTEEDEGSWMNLIWFAEIDDDKTTKAFIEEALNQIDWKASASGFRD
jgi:NAD-dependent SIR2 family protein deacetylase